MEKTDLKHRVPWGYRIFKEYIRLFTDQVYYAKTWYLGTEHIPADGNPVLIASNHQNSLNDALGILMAVNDRMPHFIVRGNVFAIHPLADKFLRSIGLLPAYRMQFEGAESMQGNGATFRDAEDALLNGHAVAIFPEAGHQPGHWLGDFSYGYTRMAFEAAERAGFEKEIYILPACNHYSDYFGLRNELMVRFGQPIALSRWYEMYRTRPRTAQREVNALVREQIRAMMLDVQDRDHYAELEFIRTSSFGRQFAAMLGKDPEKLPERLEADRELVAAVEGAGPLSEAAYAAAGNLIESEKALGITEDQFDRKPKWADTFLNLAALIVLVPLALFCLWPALPCWLIPMGVYRAKAKDPMFQGTFLIALNVLFVLPLLGLVTLVAAGICLSWWKALVWVLLFPLLCIFEAYYVKWCGDVAKDFRWLSLRRRGALARPEADRDALAGALEDILNRNDES